MNQLRCRYRIAAAAAILLFSAIALTYLYAKELHSLASNPAASDFYKFYLSATNYTQGNSPYWPWLNRATEGDPCYFPAGQSLSRSQAGIDACLHPNLNPPFFVLLTSPFAYFDYSTALVIWSAMSALAGIIAIWFILKELWPRMTKPAAIFLTILLFAYHPTFISIQYGQVTLVFLLLLVISWGALRNRQWLVAGIALGVLASIKPFFGLIIAGLVLAGYWRTFFFSIIAGLTTLLIGLIAMEPGAYLGYLEGLSIINWYSYNWNASLRGYISPLLGSSEGSYWNMPIFSSVLIYTLSAVVALVLFVAIVSVKRLHATNNKLLVDVIYMTSIPSMLLLSPLGWLYYFPFLIISAAIIIKLSSKLETKKYYHLSLIVLAILTIFPSYLSRKSHESLVDLLWLSSTGTYSLVLIFVTGVVLAFALKKRPSSATQENAIVSA